MHYANLRVDRPKDLPDEAYWQMTDASIELRRQEAGAAKAYYDRLQQAKRKYVDQLHSIIGAKKLPKYLAAQKEQKERLHAARQKVDGTSRSLKEFNDFRTKLVAQSREFLGQLGVDITQVRRSRKDLRNKLEASFKDTLGKGQSAAKTNRKVKNKTFVAPFSG